MLAIYWNGLTTAGALVGGGFRSSLICRANGSWPDGMDESTGDGTGNIPIRLSSDRDSASGVCCVRTRVIGD